MVRSLRLVGVGIALLAHAGCRLDDRPVVIVDAAGSGRADGGGNGSGGPDAACYPRATMIEPAYTHGGQGTFATESCMRAGCHGQGSVMPFAVAGTIVTPMFAGAAGAHVLFEPASFPTVFDVVTDTAGNFYVTGNAPADAFPATVGISLCPTIKFMPSPITQEQGDCNACHDGSVTTELIVGGN